MDKNCQPQFFSFIWEFKREQVKHIIGCWWVGKCFKKEGNVKEVTKLMINEFKIDRLGYDFMGYCLQKNDIYTFHHLIVPNRENGPYARWNGAILCGKTSHPYLHIIENKDYDMFSYITSEMIDINVKGYIDIINLMRIDDVLCQFEKEHCSDRTKKGKQLIKTEFTKRLLR